MRQVHISLMLILSVFTLSAATLLSGCGKPEYINPTRTASGADIGFRNLPAKVDILLVVDNSPSAALALHKVQSTLENFVMGMKSMYWDYHIAKVNMVNSDHWIHQVLVNPEFNTEKYPDGTIKEDKAGIVPANYAVNSPQLFNLVDGIENVGSDDMTYDVIYKTLYNAKHNAQLKKTQFLRADATLAIIVITNGTEFTVDPNHNGNINYTALNQHRQNLLKIKDGNSELIRFYPIAAYKFMEGKNGDSCLAPGGKSYEGGSYFAMNPAIKGLPKIIDGRETLNFCNASSLQNVMTDIQDNLKKVRQAYVYTSIVLPYPPIVTGEGKLKFGHIIDNGNNNGEVDESQIKFFEENAVDGWTYEGKGTTYTVTGIFDVVQNKVFQLFPGLDKRTGYIIKLHGKARIFGNKVPYLEYKIDPSIPKD